MNRGKKTKGIALISVLFIAAVVLILASTFIFTIVREQQSTNATRLVSDALQTADAVSERARLEVVHTFYNSFKQAPDFVREVSALLYPGNSAPSKDAALKTKIVDSKILDTNSPALDGGKQAWWRVVGATRFSTTTGKALEPTLYIEVAATAQTATGIQTVVRRVNMGESQIFDLAMLARNTDCIYCHLRVNGDVGSLGDLQPGWDKSSGVASGAEFGGSVVNGNAYIAGKAGLWSGAVGSTNRVNLDTDTDLNSNPNSINGARFTGQIREEFTGEPLPQKDGVNAFPAIDRNIGKTANGSISGGTIYTVDIGGTLSGVPSSSNVTGGTLKGAQNKNVVLIGTEANPIVLNGDVYFDGDVVIQGYVTGRGAIYSDRNVYVAGNVQYSNPANCKNATNKDACAQQAIRDKKDELRLGARGNVVLGDFTEVDGAGAPKNWQGLQAADFYRRQFGFKSETNTKCYDRTNGDELEPIKDLSTGAITGYQNIDGNSIDATNQICVPEKGNVNQDAYSYSMRPGRIDPSDGSFDSWLSDGLYQSILGQETRKYDSWRYDITNRTAISSADIEKQFGKYGLSDASKTDILNAIKTGGGQPFDVKNDAGEIVGRVNWDGNTIRVTIDAAFSYEKQTTKVDAFLYANQRIAGKTFSAPLVINGGMISEEIGVLAPGVTRLSYLNDPRYDFLGNPNDTTSPRPDCTSAAFVENFAPVGGNKGLTQDELEALNVYQPESDDCALTINYDYRLRNGGLGYSLVAMDVGQTLSWRIGDEKADQVKP